MTYYRLVIEDLDDATRQAAQELIRAAQKAGGRAIVGEDLAVYDKYTDTLTVCRAVTAIVLETQQRLLRAN